jgi:hypothetical protein
MCNGFNLNPPQAELLKARRAALQVSPKVRRSLRV